MLTMIFAGENTCIAAVLEHYRERSMATNVQERIQVALAVTDDEKWIARDCEFRISTWCLEAKLVGDKEPSPGKDCSTFALVYSSCGIPGCR